MLRTDVSALYVDNNGVYPSLVADWWDADRDATKYAGPNPIVAHPPCGPWSALRHLWTRGEQELGPMAVAQVRRFGGVLEHPAYSRLFEHCRMPKPGEFGDEHGGQSYEVQQCDFGHPARKRTWIYVVGLAYSTPTFPPHRAPTHWCSGGRTPSSRHGSPVPPGIKVCSAQQRRRTPVAFAEWLLGLAAQCGSRSS